MGLNKKYDLYKLNFEKTYSYFFDQIDEGNTLSKAIVKRIDFQVGNFYTILPKKISKDLIYNFSSGGIISPEKISKDKIHLNGLGDFFYQKLSTMDFEFSNLILNFLKQEKDNIALIEYVVASPNDQHLKKDNIKTLLYDNEVYYYLDQSNTEDEIFKAITKAGSHWHSLGVLAKDVKLPLHGITSSNFETICDNVKYIFVGAYDGEGYIFWEK